MISLIATEVMFLSMGYLWCVASTTISRQLGTTTIYTCSHKKRPVWITPYLINYQDGWLYRLYSLSCSAVYS